MPGFGATSTPIVTLPPGAAVTTPGDGAMVACADPGPRNWRLGVACAKARRRMKERIKVIVVGAGGWGLGAGRTQRPVPATSPQPPAPGPQIHLCIASHNVLPPPPIAAP